MSIADTVASVAASQLKPAAEIPFFTVGDTLNVHVRIIEGGKERIQVYQGVLMAMKGRGVNRTITVRRIVANEGVERIFPLHSPRIAQLEIVRRADARRAKLYYLRNRVGKSRRLRDQRRGLQRMEAVGDAATAEMPTGGPAGTAAAPTPA
jgi:large subunit ribosomal protein L19